MNTTAYLVYCSDNKNIADDITNDIKRVGIEFIHDTFDSMHQYHKDQYTFGNPQIFLLVTDNFLKSEACMKNVMDLVLNPKLKNRITTIVADGKQRVFGTKEFETIPTKFERLGDVVKYIDYWSIPYQEIRTEMRHASDERKAELEPRLEVVQNISTSIVGDFMRYLRSANTVAYKRLQSDNFRQVFEAFGAKGTDFISTYKGLPTYVSPEVEVSEMPILESEALSESNLERNYEVDGLAIPGLDLLPDIEEKVTELADEKLDIVKEELTDNLESVEDLKTDAENVVADKLETAGDDLEVVKDNLETAEEQLETVENELGSVKESVSESVEDLKTDAENVVADKLETAGDDLEVVKDNLETVEEQLETVENELGSVKESADDLKTDAENVEESVDSVLDEIAETNIDVNHEANENLYQSKNIESNESIEFTDEIPDNILEDLAAEIVEPTEENSIQDEVLNEIFNDNSDAVKTDAELASLIDELAEDILAENEPLEALATLEEEKEAAAEEDLATTLDEIVKENSKILEGQKDNDVFHSEKEDKIKPIETSMPIDVLIDEIAEDLVTEMNDEDSSVVEVSEDVLGEKAADDSHELSDSEEPVEKTTVEIAEDLANGGDLKGASGLYRQLIGNAPNDVELRYAFAMLLIEHGGDSLLAKEHLLKAAEFDAEDEDVLFALGNIYEKAEDYDTAKGYYEKVILLDLEHEQAYYHLGNLLANHYEKQEFVASSYLQRAISLDDEYAIAHLQYAKLLKNYFGKNKKATKHFKKALKYNRNLAEAHIELANLQLSSDKEGKALNHYQSAIALDNRLSSPENDDKFGLTALRAQEKLAATIGSNIQNNGGGNKTALITGATSGIGRATAELFAQAGYSLIITGRRTERLAALKSILEDDFKIKVLTLTFDVRNQKDTENAIAGLTGDWRNIDILINNAGLAKGFAPINEGNLDHWETMIDTNIKGLLYVTRAVSPLMVDRKSGYIINIGSVAGKETYLNGNVYCATKAAVDVLTKGMRLDLHKHNIRISAVHPGHVETEFALVRFDGDEEKAKIYGGFQPLKASDVADTIYYLATRPAHVNIEDVVMWSTQQASATVIDRSGREKFVNG